MITIISRSGPRPTKCKSELNGDMDGVIHFTDLSQQASIYGNPKDELEYYADGPIDDYAYAGGIKRYFANRRANKKEKLRIKRLRAEGTAAAKTTRAKAKEISATAQQTAASKVGPDNDAATIAALQQNTTTPAASTGLSTGAWLGIGAGVLVLIIGGVLVYRKMKKGK